MLLCPRHVSLGCPPHVLTAKLGRLCWKDSLCLNQRHLFSIPVRTQLQKNSVGQSQHRESFYSMQGRKTPRYELIGPSARSRSWHFQSATAILSLVFVQSRAPQGYMLYLQTKTLLCVISHILVLYYTALNNPCNRKKNKKTIEQSHHTVKITHCSSDETCARDKGGTLSRHPVHKSLPELLG